MHPSLTKTKLLQGPKEETPFYSIKSFLKIQEEKNQILVAFFRPAKTLLGHEYIIQYAPALHKACLVRPDNLGELHTEPASEGLGQNFIETSQEGDRSPVIELGPVPGFGNKGDDPFVDEGRSSSRSEHYRTSVKERWGDLRFEFLEEFHRNVVMTWGPPFGDCSDCFRDVFEGEVLDKPLVHCWRDLDRDTFPAFLLGLPCARGRGIRGVKFGIETRDVESQIALTPDYSFLGFELPKESFLFPNAVEVKEGF